MHKTIAQSLACPVCRKPLVFEGKETTTRFVNGHFKCERGHTYHVKEEIGVLKDEKLSANEFEWKVDVSHEKKYDEIRNQYDSYLREDQKAAMCKMIQRLADLVISSNRGSSDVVLDIATGMGTFILSLAEKASGSILLLGTDIDERPLRGVMNRAMKLDTWHRLSLAVMDAKRLALKDASLSTVSSHFGFDSVPETVSAFKECARVLRAGGRVFFSSLWLKEGSESTRLAEKHKVCQIGGRTMLEKALDEAELTLEGVEEIYSGVWPRNPMDLLPVEGDEYSHVIVHVRKQKR
jgi:ubiquinone/menaquinone biosynthesis C-methylase UbiE/uncharacterized protein YbaR (Trm112 family)